MDSGGPKTQKTKPQRVWQLFLAYLKSMLFAFTGGSMTLPLLQQQLSDRYGLMSREEVLENFALGQALPGVISLNTGILIGRAVAGWAGAFAAMAGCLLPAFFGMLFITFSYGFLEGLSWVSGVIGGIRAAGVAVILSNAVVILGANRGLFPWLLAAAALFTTLVLGWNILLVVLLCGGAGAVRAALRKNVNPTPGGDE